MGGRRCILACLPSSLGSLRLGWCRRGRGGDCADVAAIRMAAGGNTYLPPELVFGRVQAESGAAPLDSLTPR